MFKINIYENANGKSNVKDYIKKLRNNTSKDSQIKFNKIIAYIRMLEEYGLQLGEPYIKKISDELWELRPTSDRILFAYVNKDEFILLSVFTNKTPEIEKKRAVRYLNEYRNRRDC